MLPSSLNLGVCFPSDNLLLTAGSGGEVTERGGLGRAEAKELVAGLALFLALAGLFTPLHRL